MTVMNDPLDSNGYRRNGTGILHNVGNQLYTGHKFHESFENPWGKNQTEEWEYSIEERETKIRFRET